MFNINRFISLLFISIFIISFSVPTFAHDTNIATFQIRQIKDQQWMYEVMTPLSNLDKSLQASIKDAPKADLHSVKYKQKVIEYIKQGFDIKITGSDDKNITIESAKLSLGKGRIKLNDHLSVVIFQIKGMPENISKMDFHLTNMSENLSHNNILRLIQGDKNKRYLLNKENNFSGSIVNFFSQ
ncbi:hypothetical protein [uncultured Psychrosphaera sp.]|uniref:hypothetical protein n=1 Tax=uncultured Psychrosphaera sp. TaxID=1403522 RepID=UPI0026079A1E|nr:hypothetical protein [uncultured Psychrosphaera sp.]